jgi:hypothetical protein
VHKALVIEYENLAWIKLMTQDWWTGWLPLRRNVVRRPKLRYGPFALPVENIKRNKLFIRSVWLVHDVGEGPEQINAEGTGASASAGRNESQKGTDDLLRLCVLKQPDSRVMPARNVRALGDGDRVVLLQAQ